MYNLKIARPDCPFYSKNNDLVLGFKGLTALSVITSRAPISLQSRGESCL